MRGTFQRRNIKAIASQHPQSYSYISSSNYNSLNNSTMSQAKPPSEMNSASRSMSLDKYATTTAQSQIINQDISKKDVNVEYSQLRQDINNSIKILSSPICEWTQLDESQKIQMKTSDSHAQISVFTDRNNQQQQQQQQQPPNSKRENYQLQSEMAQLSKKINTQSSKENFKQSYLEIISRDYDTEDRLRNQSDYKLNTYYMPSSTSKTSLHPVNGSNNNSFSNNSNAGVNSLGQTQKYVSPIPISNYSFESQIFKENNNYNNMMKENQKHALHQSYSNNYSNVSSATKQDAARNASFDFGKSEKLYYDKPLSYQPLRQFNSQDVYIDKKNDKASSSSFAENYYAPRPSNANANQFISTSFSSRSNTQTQPAQQETANLGKNTLRTSSGSNASSTIKNFSFQVQLNSLNNKNNKENILTDNSKQNTHQSQEDSFSNYSQNFEGLKHHQFSKNNHNSSKSNIHNTSVSSVNYINSNTLTAQSSRREGMNDFLNDLQIGFDNPKVKQQQQLPQTKSSQQLLYTHIHQLGEDDYDMANTNKDSIQTAQLYDPQEQTFQNIENQITRSHSRSSSTNYEKMKESELKELKSVLNDSNQQVKDLLKENRKLNEKYQNVNEELIKTQHKLENLQTHYQDIQLKLHSEKTENAKAGELQIRYNDLQLKYEDCLEKNKQLLEKADKLNGQWSEKVIKIESKYDLQTEKLEKAIEKIDQMTIKNTELMIASQKEREHFVQMLSEAKQKQENELKEKQLLRIELQEEKQHVNEVRYLKAQCEMYEAQLKEKVEMIEQLQRQIIDKTKQIDILNTSILENMTQLQEVQTVNKRKEIEMKAQNSKLIQEHQTLSETIEIQRVEKDTLNQKLKRLTQNMDEIDAIRSENMDLAQQFKEMYQENEKLLLALKEKEFEGEEIEKQREQIVSLKEKNERLSEQNQLISQQLQDASSEIMNLHQQSKYIEKQLKDVQYAYDELKSNSLMHSRQVEELMECQDQLKNYKQKYTQLKQRQLIDAEKFQQQINKYQEVEKSYDHLLKEYNEMKAEAQQVPLIKQRYNEQTQKIEEMQVVAQQNAQNEQMLMNLQQIIQQQEQAINNLNNERQNLLNNNQYKQQIAQAQQENQGLLFKLTEKAKENEYLKMQLMNANQSDGIVNELRSKLSHVLNENQRLNQILYERCKNSWN